MGAVEVRGKAVGRVRLQVAPDASVFGTLKNWLRGIHHGVGPDHLQAYLDEFAFRSIRPRPPMAVFQTLLGLASGAHGPTTYEMLYASESAR